ALIEMDSLEQRASHPHDERTLDLILQMERVDDRTALERRHDSGHLHLAGGVIDGKLCTGGDIAALLRAARQTITATGRSLAFVPAEMRCRRFEDGLEPRVLEILEPESEGIHLDGVCQIVDM